MKKNNSKENIKASSNWRNPLPWITKKVSGNGYDFFYLFDADGELVDLNYDFNLKYICQVLNE